MTNSFIFCGDFEDPHKEFFVKKMYRKKQPINSQFDFIFMFTNKQEKDIPCFLIDIAPVIFKAGSSLHLLRK